MAPLLQAPGRPASLARKANDFEYLAREARVSLEESVQALLGRIPLRSPAGPLILDEVEIILCAAIDGVGRAFMSEEHVTPHFRSGALVRVLEDPFPGFFLYYLGGQLKTRH